MVSARCRACVNAWPLAALLAASPAAAQTSPNPEAATIEWSSGRPLAIADFKGKLPASLRFGSRSWIKIETTWGCAGKTLMANAVAVFDPQQSWWRGARWNVWEDVDTRREWLERSRADAELKRNLRYSDADLLRHEQTHFDLAELAAARIRERLRELEDICANPDKDAIVTRIVREINAQFREEQTRYDTETIHGTDAMRQRQWNERAARDLAARGQSQGR